MSAYRVACVQFAPRKARVEENLDRIAVLTLAASADGAELVVFSETAATGYFLEGGVLDAARTTKELCEELDRRLRGSLRRSVDVVVGFYEKHEGNLHNSAAYMEVSPRGTTLRACYRKFFLPTYGVFDEERFVGRGNDLTVFDTRLGRFAILICEDVWHGVLPTLCALRGAQAIVAPTASPARDFGHAEPANHARYRRLFRDVSEAHGVYCLNAQLCGFEGGKGFVGGSMVVDPFGTVVAEAPLAQDHALFAEIDLELVAAAQAQGSRMAQLRAAWPELRRLATEPAR